MFKAISTDKHWIMFPNSNFVAVLIRIGVVYKVHYPAFYKPNFLHYLHGYSLLIVQLQYMPLFKCSVSLFVCTIILMKYIKAEDLIDEHS